MKEKNKSQKIWQTPPKVRIQSQGLAENRYVDDGKTWGAATLVAWAKEKGYKTFKYPLATFNLATVWNIETTRSLLFHCKRINNANLDYPIIFDIDGCIADGYHRCMKAILEGRTEIDAIRLEEMPQHDGYEKAEN